MSEFKQPIPQGNDLMTTSATTGQVVDTYTIIKELVGAGMPEPQAEIIMSSYARLAGEHLATKQDIEGIHKDIEVLRAETKKDIEGIHKDIEIIHKDIEVLRAETKKDIEVLRAETQQSFAAVQKDIQVLSSQLTVRMGAMLVATVGLLASLQIFAG